MKTLLAVLFAFTITTSFAQKDSTPTLKSILLEQLKTRTGKLERQFRKSFYCYAYNTSYILEQTIA